MRGRGHRVESMNSSSLAGRGSPISDDDAALERRIECARIAMTLATDDMSRRDHLERMERLIGQRSDAQKARMEARLPKPFVS
jgi:hypothetical protein